MGGPKGLIPFYAYLNKFFRKTLAPREGDVHNISSYGENLLYALTPSEPEFSVFDTLITYGRKSSPYLNHLKSVVVLELISCS